MDASVTLKLTIGELDTIRQALRDQAQELHEDAMDASASPAERSRSRTAEAKLRDLIGRLDA